jgi:hypothetical protein
MALKKTLSCSYENEGVGVSNSKFFLEEIVLPIHGYSITRKVNLPMRKDV